MINKGPHAGEQKSTTPDDEISIEIQQLVEGISDPSRRRKALDLMRGLALSEPVASEQPLPVGLFDEAAGANTRILLVDDDSDILVSVGGFLEAEGMDVERCGSGAEALRLLTLNEPFDAVVTDVSMPEMSGPEFLVAARKIRASLPALIITGNTRFAGSSELPVGVAVLLKPFSRKEFIAQVTALLDQSKLRATGPAGGS